MRLKLRGDQKEQNWVQNASPPRASGAGPEPNICPNRPKNESKITLLRVLGGRCGTKGPQELSRYPPRPKMVPKLVPKATPLNS